MSENGDVAKILQWPIKIKDIRIKGLKRTKESFFKHHLAPLKQANTYADVDTRIKEVTKLLRGLDIFQEIRLILDKIPDDADNHDILAIVEEKELLGGKIQMLQNPSTGSQALELSGSLRNALGAAEQLKVSANIESMTHTNGTVEFRKPYPFGNFATFDLCGFLKVNDNSYSSSYLEHSRGGKMILSDLSGCHHIGYTYDWRDVLPSSRDKDTKKPSESVKSSAKSSVKSSIDYRFSFSTLDSYILPTKGQQINFSTELAGIGGDVSFGKVEADAKFYFPIHRYVSVGASFRCGYLRPFSDLLSMQVDTKNANTLINDRFFLGGPMVLRGFDVNSVGPHDLGDRLGGDLYSSVGIETSFTLPFKMFQETGVRGHFFANCGNLIALHDTEVDRKRKLPIENFSMRKNPKNHANGTDENIAQLISGLRATVGIGLLIPSPLGRIEFNLSHPVRAFPGDSVKRWQFGIGAVFS